MNVFSVLLARRSPAAATELPGAVCFSSFMLDDAQSLARALKRRDPDLMDRLIEQYQFRLFRYLLHLTGSQERAEDFFSGDVAARAAARPSIRRQVEI